MRSFIRALLATCLLALFAAPAYAEDYFKIIYNNRYIACGSTDPNVAVSYSRTLGGYSGTLEVDRNGKVTTYPISIGVEKTVAQNLSPKKRPSVPRVVPGVACRVMPNVKVAHNCKPNDAEGSCTICSEDECDFVSWKIETGRN